MRSGEKYSRKSYNLVKNIIWSFGIVYRMKTRKFLRSQKKFGNCSFAQIKIKLHGLLTASKNPKAFTKISIRIGDYCKWFYVLIEILRIEMWRVNCMLFTILIDVIYFTLHNIFILSISEFIRVLFLCGTLVINKCNLICVMFSSIFEVYIS